MSGDSIPKGINIRLLNKKLLKSKVVRKSFPGTTSKDFVHYIKPTLQENEFDTSTLPWMILHMGVNDVSKLGSNNDTVSKDIVNIANHCKNFGVKQMIISGLTLTTRLNASFIQLKFFAKKHGYSFIDNNNVSSENLQQDGLHLNNSGKGVLLKNHVITLNGRVFLGPRFT